MGIDVYLSWDGMAEDEKKARDSDWLELESGNLGYLRAAWWMKREVHLLCDIFPSKCWIDESPVPVPYNFKAMTTKLERAVESYRESVKKDELSRGGSAACRDLLDKAPRESGFIDYPFDGLVLDDAEGWLKSVRDFFKLGTQKQTEGRNPKVHML